MRKPVGEHSYSGGFWLPRQATCGRLLIDTFLSARELIRETNYDLQHLASSQLKVQRTDFDEARLPQLFLNATSLVQVVEHTERDAFLTLELMFKLAILPLTKQLTNIAGNLWFRSLQNARAERNEMLLCHEFYNRKYVLPDKKYFKPADTANPEDGEKKKGKRKAAYEGGLVLEPKRGYYDHIVLLLDFNSLYPSIIQEYNLCFTTVERKATHGLDGNPIGGDVALNDQEFVEEDEKPDKSLKAAILPGILKSLVEKRKHVKDLLKAEKSEERRQQLDIRQKAIKLTANSMYGCLGFSHSRFHAKAIAALITRTGREILQQTVDIAQNKVTGIEVIYGDTDSIMIATKSLNLQDSLKLGRDLKNEVNRLYNCLEIEIDGVFRSLLLLKKKKYAALKYDNPFDPQSQLSKEMKGLDIVRRDWCPLSKRMGNFVLDALLSSMSIDDLQLHINEYAEGIRKSFQTRKVALNEFIITKQLSRAPQEYNDPKSMPHV